MKEQPQFLELPFGTLELDDAGIVLRYDAAQGQSPRVQASDVVGRNFFRDVALVTELENIEERFKELLAGDGHSQKSSIFLLFASPAVQIQLLPATDGVQPTDGRKGKVLVRIEHED